MKMIPTPKPTVTMKSWRQPIKVTWLWSKKCPDLVTHNRLVWDEQNLRRTDHRYKRRSESAPNGLGLVNMPYTKPNPKPTLPLGAVPTYLRHKSLPLGGLRAAAIKGVLDLKRRCAEWSVYDIKAPLQVEHRYKLALQNTRSRGRGWIQSQLLLPSIAYT